MYGSDEETARRMRSYQGGLLKTLPVFREFGLKDLLPPNLHAPDEGCIRPSKDIFCFDAGEWPPAARVGSGRCIRGSERRGGGIAVRYRFSDHAGSLFKGGHCWISMFSLAGLQKFNAAGG